LAAIGCVHVPLEQTSLVHEMLSLAHALPSADVVQEDVLADGVHVWQLLLALTAPPAKHAPPMRQLFACSGWVHAPALHVSLVHARPSSVHAAPSALLHDVVLALGWHVWQPLLGFGAFAA